MANTAKLVVQTIVDITTVSFEDARLLEAAQIEHMGTELYRLVDEMDRRKLILDFTKVQFLASAAVGVLINLRNKVNERKGKLVICGLRKPLMQVFEIMKLTKLFTFCPDDKAALKVFGIPT